MTRHAHAHAQAGQQAGCLPPDLGTPSTGHPRPAQESPVKGHTAAPRQAQKLPEPSPQPAVPAVAMPVPAPVHGLPRAQPPKRGGHQSLLSLLGRPLPLPPQPFNAFVNDSEPLLSAWGVFRTLAVLPLFLLRVGIVLAAVAVALVCTNLALLGARDDVVRPFPPWRRNLLWPVAWCARVLLFALGYHYIEVRGRAAPREVAPVLVCNHVSAVDPIFLFMEHLPMLVTAQENVRIPIAGLIMRALQVVQVDRETAASRRAAGAEIKSRAACNDWPRVALFPEATTASGRAVISFRTGAFAPGLPVQPVVVHYPHTQLDPSWVVHGPDWYLVALRCMLCFHNHMVVEYLPPLFPTAAELKDPRLYAERCRGAMAQALNLPMTEHAFGDVALAHESQRLRMHRGAGNLEFGLFQRLFGLGIPEAKGYLRRFKALDITGRGQVCMEDFLAATQFPRNSGVREAFEFFDAHEYGAFSFREFVTGAIFLLHHAQFNSQCKAIFTGLGVDAANSLTAKGFKRGLSNAIPFLSPHQVDHIFLTFGLDKVDAVNLQDFASILRIYPEYYALLLASVEFTTRGVRLVMPER